MVIIYSDTCRVLFHRNFFMYADSAIFFSVYILTPITVARLIVKSYYSYFCPLIFRHSLSGIMIVNMPNFAH